MLSRLITFQQGTTSELDCRLLALLKADMKCTHFIHATQAYANCTPQGDAMQFKIPAEFEPLVHIPQQAFVLCVGQLSISTVNSIYRDTLNIFASEQSCSEV